MGNLRPYRRRRDARALVALKVPRRAWPFLRAARRALATRGAAAVEDTGRAGAGPQDAPGDPPR